MIKTNKKLIKLNDDEISELTLDECYIIYKPILIKLSNNYHNIKLEFNDRFQIACLGFVKAYNSYNNLKYCFLGYLKIIVNNEFKQEYRKQSIKKDFNLVSIDNHIPDNYDITLEEVLRDETDNFNEIEIKDLINRIFSKMSDNDKKVVKLRLEGFKKPKISEILNLSIPSINYRLLKFKNELMKEVSL